MNRRQKKKRDKIVQLCIESGYHYIPTYMELKQLERAYHEFCINNYRAEREMDRILSNKLHHNRTVSKRHKEQI